MSDPYNDAFREAMAIATLAVNERDDEVIRMVVNLENPHLTLLGAIALIRPMVATVLGALGDHDLGTDAIPRTWAEVASSFSQALANQER